MSITDDLYSRLQDGHIGRIGEQLGISQAQAQSAVAAALPLLVGALGRNSQQPAGASSLFNALGRHAGVGVGSAVDAGLGGNGDGNSILGHIFGRRQDSASQGLGAATGLGSERAGALLRLLEAASDLGARPWRTFLSVTLPLSRAGIIAGSMLVAIPVVGEFVIPELLGGPSTLMIGKVLWDEFFNNRDWPVASAVSTVMLLLLLVPIMIFHHFEQKEMEHRLT